MLKCSFMKFPRKRHIADIVIALGMGINLVVISLIVYFYVL